VPLPGGGAIADTPGFGLPTLDAVSSRQLGELFPEFAAAAEAATAAAAAAAAEAEGGGGRREGGGGGCRFDDCLHVAEPGCVVRGAGLERHPYYLKFLAEVKVRGAGVEAGDRRVRAV
jgi:ribosome biogenesis GTPase